MEEVAVAVGAAVWIVLAFLVPAFMARRGHDWTAWFAVSVLFGPVAMLFALGQRRWLTPPRSGIVRRGERAEGGLDLLVVGSGPPVETARAVLQLVGDQPSSVTLAQALPFDGPRAAEREAAEQLKEDAKSLGRLDAELMLLFGDIPDAIIEELEKRQRDLVVTDVDIAARLPDPDALVAPGAIDADRALRVWSRRSERAHVD